MSFLEVSSFWNFWRVPKIMPNIRLFLAILFWSFFCSSSAWVRGFASRVVAITEDWTVGLRVGSSSAISVSLSSKRKLRMVFSGYWRLIERNRFRIPAKSTSIEASLPLGFIEVVLICAGIGRKGVSERTSNSLSSSRALWRSVLKVGRAVKTETD